ncbi:MAG TPA: HAD-IA family hydrolase [Actinomycetota bacterium]|nr:HAD-IA family hydrolase [Actinomycetota bacterium]
MTKPLEAVVFDVDGTLAETERHGHRVAFNKAFEQEGYPYRWSDELYRELVKTTGGGRRIARYLTEYEGFDPEEARAVADKLHPIKTQLFVDTILAGEVPGRAGVYRFIKSLQQANLRTAVATTGTTSWVHPLVKHLADEGGFAPFEVVVTGNEVEHLKPAPDLFQEALRRLGLEPDQVVMVEDSRNGVRSAMATGGPCLVARGEYARTEELEGADLIVDGYGDEGAPLTVLSNPRNLEVGPMLTPELVVELHRRWQERSRA